MHAAFSALSYLILAILLPLPASADDWSGCKAGTPDLRIAACTRIIDKGVPEPAALASAYRYRASAYTNAKDKGKAEEDLNRAIKIDPAHAVYYRGLIYFANGDQDRAIAAFGDAIQSEPGNAAIYNSRGAAYNAKGSRDLAIADYSEAIRLDPGFVLALSNRSSAQRLKGEFDPAIADASKAIELKPDNPVAYVARGWALGKKGELDAAIADCSKAAELDPGYAEAYDCKGYTYYGKREYDKAIEEENRAINLSPQLSGAYVDRGIAYAAKRDLDRALVDYEKAIEINQRSAPAYNNRANIYIARNEIDRSIDSLNKAIEVDPKYTLAYYNRGRAYEKKNDAERALADYRKVLDLPAVSVTDKQRQEMVRQRIARLTEAQRGLANEAAGVQKPAADANTADKRAPAMSEQARRAGRVALVIGNSSYAHAGQLPNPKNDAAGVAASLRRLGFGEVMEMYDLDRQKMGQALKHFGDLADTADWAVVFFAGHGLEMNGVSYIIPTDAELLRDTHVTDEAISLTQVQAKVDAASKLGLVILNSCRNNPFLEHMSRSLGGTRAIGRGLANVEPEGNVLVAYSAKHGTTALDGEGGHSPFTEALLSHIEEPGLEINFLFRKVRDDVRSKTQRQQEPFLYGSLSAELLYFRPAAAQ